MTMVRRSAPRRKKAAPPRAGRGEGKRPRRTLRTWGGVDCHLCRLARLDRRIEAIHARAAARAAPLREQAKVLLGEVQRFADAHEGDFGRDHGLCLPHGRVISRPRARLVFHASREQLVTHLENRGLDLAVMTTKRPSREILETFPTRLLAAVGIEREWGRELVVKFGPGRSSKMVLIDWPDSA